MTKNEQGKRAILGVSLFISALLLLALTFQSCQKDEMIFESENIDLKSSALSEIYLDYPEDAVAAGEDFNITFSSSCGRIMIERGFTGDMDEYGVITNKVYKGLTCDTENLLWEAVGLDEFETCEGATITENLTEPGTYVYRAKLNFKGKTDTECPDCEAFLGNKFECFTITVAAGNLNEGTFTDARDGHVYKWIKIGNQIWMAENLAFLPGSGSYAYNNDENNIATYGRLYTLEAAQAACPEGWHLPENDEWNTLITYLYNNDYGYEGNTYWVAKALASTTGWFENPVPGNVGNDQQSNNSSGFNAFPGGWRSTFGTFGTFYDIGLHAYWWTATFSYDSHNLIKNIYTGNNIVSGGIKNHAEAIGVRCVKNAE